MAGLLTHFAIAFICALIIFLIAFKSKYKWIYSFAFFIGSLIPDLVDFGITGLKMGSLAPLAIMKDKWFYPLARFSHNFWHWLIIAGIIILIVFILYKLNKVSKKFVFAIIIASIIFLLAIIIHLNLDFYIIEPRWWI